jgi:glycosyltransferase involved in cell wall biosynthesis
MKVLVFPRDPGPYQGLLYGRLEALGVRVRYVGDETPSRTLNLALLPLTLLACRLRGYRLLHVHWLFSFALPGARRLPAVDALARVLYAAMLGSARILGIRVVWTVHNVLPHERVFADDIGARRRLLRSSERLIVHSTAALDELRQHVGAPTPATTVVPLAPTVAIAPEAPDARRRRTLLFFGNVAPYKGVEDLLEAFAAVESPGGLRLVVAGRCADSRLAGRLAARAAALGPRVDLRLGHVDAHDADALFADARALVLPFRRITTSSTALQGLARGVPVVIPSLPGLAELPDTCAVRYDGSVAGLTAALRGVAEAPDAEIAARGEAGRRHARRATWPDAAVRTRDAYALALAGGAR